MTNEQEEKVFHKTSINWYILIHGKLPNKAYK